MCGICGTVLEEGRTVDHKLLEKMTGVLSHRGPDDSGFYFSQKHPNVAFGHRRLSIIDLDTGHQPITNEDGTIVLVYNGEIYNFRQLKNDLERKNHVFKTKSDTEVIVHLYEEYGPDCVKHLRGMFAYAIYDENRNRTVLARDRLGQKPLVYYHKGNNLLFSSEIKSLLFWDAFEKNINFSAIDYYLTYQYIPYPHTIFRDVYKLPPAHFLVYENGQARLQRYWQIDYDREEDLPEAEHCARIRKVFDEATEMRLISDVPLGAFLSGGIDSTIVVGTMAKFSSTPVKTFSIGFEEKKFDELAYARVAAEAFKTDHHEFTVKYDSINILPKLIWHYNEPFADSSAIPTYYVSKCTRQFVKVALSGDAGDENFGGYERYLALKLASRIDRLPKAVKTLLTSRAFTQMPSSVKQKTFLRRVKRFLAPLKLSPEERYLVWISIFDKLARSSLYTRDFKMKLADFDSSHLILDEYARLGTRDITTRTALVDIATYLPNDILVKVDIASMASSLETRSPFLDYKVVETAAAIPSKYKIKGRNLKHILKKAFSDLLPEKILKRGKMGFGVPIANWFRTDLRDYVRDVLLNERSLDRGFFDASSVTSLVDEHLQGRRDNGYKLWALLNLELWMRMFYDGDDWRDFPQTEQYRKE